MRSSNLPVVTVLLLLVAHYLRADEQLVAAGYGIEKASLALDSRGRPHIVSDEGLSGRKVFYSYPDVGGWKTVEIHPQGKAAGITSEPHIALGKNDSAWIGLHTASPVDRRDATVSFYRIDNISTKPVLGPLTQSVRGTRTHVVTDRDGRLYVFWRMNTDLFYEMYDIKGENASAVHRLTNVKVTIPDEEMGLCSNSFDVDVGPDGLAHGVCTNILGLMYSNSELEAADRGVQMIARGHLVGCEGPYTVPVIRVDRANPAVVYVLFAGVENKAYLILKTATGWKRPVLVAPAGRQQAGRRAPPALVATPGGGAIAGWMDARSGNSVVYMRRISPTGVFGPEAQVTSGQHPRLAVDGQGIVHVVYTRDGNLYYQKVPALGSATSPKLTEVSR